MTNIHNNVVFNLFPGGVSHCITMSYDDGANEDIRLAEIFRQNGIKASFHLNSRRIGVEGEDAANNISEVYRGHEVSCHTVTHPFPTLIHDSSNFVEILDDRRALENACGYVVRGMSYPYGCYNDNIINIYRSCGMEYARTTNATNNFYLPEDFMKWHPTCHHSKDILQKLTDFLADTNSCMKLLYIWGHSYEFRLQNNWELIEEFSKAAGGRDNVWYATNIEIVDYVNALHALRVSLNGDRIYNPSGTTVWVTVKKQPIKIEPLQTVCI